jgi:uncharacterized protein YqhQ
MSEQSEQLRMPSYGGQAVMEGVMMRGERVMAIAVRDPWGGIVVETEPLPPSLYASRWSKVPFLRGLVTLWDALGIGMKAMIWSTNVALKGKEPVVQIEGRGAWALIGGGAALALGLFLALPALIAALLDHLFPSSAASNGFEGTLRLAMMVGYIVLISRLPDVRRVFAYHGAEHKTINALEHGARLEPRTVARYSIRHARCGTAFLLFVVVISTGLFALLGQPDWWIRVGSRLVLIPLVAAVAYEVLKLGARMYDRSVLARWLMAPGLALQALTTREPDLPQIEVAIAALQAVLVAEGREPVDVGQLAERAELVAAPAA